MFGGGGRGIRIGTVTSIPTQERRSPWTSVIRRQTGRYSPGAKLAASHCKNASRPSFTWRALSLRKKGETVTQGNEDATRQPATSAMVGIGQLKGLAPSLRALRCRLCGGTEAQAVTL